MHINFNCKKLCSYFICSCCEYCICAFLPLYHVYHNIHVREWTLGLLYCGCWARPTRLLLSVKLEPTLKSDVSATAHKPGVSATAHKPDVSAKAHKPDVSATTHKSDESATAQPAMYSRLSCGTFIWLMSAITASNQPFLLKISAWRSKQHSWAILKNKFEPIVYEHP